MLTGVILAGGNNQLIDNVPKSLLQFGGKPLILRQLQLMASICDEFIVVTNDPKPFLKLLPPEIRIITDYLTNRGPLGGMHAGLSLAKNRMVWIVGNHMPNISAQLAEKLKDSITEQLHAVIPSTEGITVPLHAVYNQNCADRIGALLQRGEQTKEHLLRALKWVEIKTDKLCEANTSIENWSDRFNSFDEYISLINKLPNLNSLNHSVNDGEFNHCKFCQ